MLDKSKETASLLDGFRKAAVIVWKRKTRLFFQRYMNVVKTFLSKGSSSESCLRQRDALGAPPHLKLRFEGSAKLTFNHEKEITHMETAENEKVEIVLRIIPASAKGLVEE